MYKVPLQWLKSHVCIDLTDRTHFTETCDAAGLEIAAIHDIRKRFDHIVAAKVMSVETLDAETGRKLVRLSTGSGEKSTVSTAESLSASSVGTMLAVALPGAHLLDSMGEIVEVTVMKLGQHTAEVKIPSLAELGLAKEDEVLLLPDTVAPGAPIADSFEDAVIEYELTPDLGRCFSIIGLATELGALFDVETSLELQSEALAAPKGNFKIVIEDADASNRYLGVLIENVRQVDTPAWIRNRLLLSGISTLNSVVDIANYVMLETGQPMHFFDYDKLRGGCITVRYAREGEKLTGLNQKQYALQPHNLIIADAERPVAIAGIIGSNDSHVDENTKRILIEMAHFDDIVVRKTVQTQKLRTDSSERYMKGTDPDAISTVIGRTLYLLRQSLPDMKVAGVVDTFPRPRRIAPLRIDSQEVRRILGIELDNATIVHKLTKFGFTCREEHGTIHVEVPTNRPDVVDASHLIEEVLRGVGFAALTEKDTLSSFNNKAEIANETEFTRMDRVGDFLCSMGYSEALNYSLTSEERAGQPAPWLGEGFHSVPMMNPLNRERTHMRTSLLWGLLDNVRENLKHRDYVSLFEIGRVYGKTATGYQEPTHAGIIRAAAAEPVFSWQTASRKAIEIENANFFWIKGAVTELARRTSGAQITFKPLEVPNLWRGRTAGVYIAYKLIGVVGDVDAALVEAQGMNTRISFAEISLEALMSCGAKELKYDLISVYPAMKRDLSIVVSRGVAYELIESVIRGNAGEHLVDLQMYDRFESKQIGKDSLSLTFSLVFQSAHRTLGSEEVQSAMDTVVAALARETAATLRS